tara:strand:+ start:512 stop:1831 length:1320 start_codon:yes stop_codon:yes gene_type:complete
MVYEIRDPVHGPIPINSGELAVIDSPVFQRLRQIRQLGFAEVTFPGATHTRYLHSLGAMHLAGLAFNAIIKRIGMAENADTRRLTRIVRLAALLHDVGHPPLSHQLEYLLPPVGKLGLDLPVDPTARASHEHMSLLLLTQSALTDIITQEFANDGIRADDIAAVLYPEMSRTDEANFKAHGVFLLPLIQKLISGELDCDRMDYLRRDAYFAGVSYGSFDQDWILSNLTAVQTGDSYDLALQARALHTFEDFLLARYHMFLMVYAHQRTQVCDLMLRSFFNETGALDELPYDVDKYIACNDNTIDTLLLEHRENRWAKRLIERDPIPLALELDEERDGVNEGEITGLLDKNQIQYFKVAVHTPLSRYCLENRGGSPLKIVFEDRVLQASVKSVEQATELYNRYRQTPSLVRYFVMEESLDDFKALRLPTPVSNLSKAVTA